MRLWKLLGLAGLAGVAATGAVLARGERQRRAYTPDDVRARLRERHAALEAEPGPAPPTTAELTAGRTHRLARLLPARGRRPRPPTRAGAQRERRAGG
ncbi:hypothetical protein [Geodermatophilus sp. SYSU D00815]